MLKLYSMVIHCETGRPSFCAGWNWMRRAAAIARSVSPSGRPLTTEMFESVFAAVRRHVDAG